MADTKKVNGSMLNYAIGEITKLIDKKADATELESKQDKLTGSTGQIVGFDGEGNAVVQNVLELSDSEGEAYQTIMNVQDDDFIDAIHDVGSTFGNSRLTQRHYSDGKKELIFTDCDEEKEYPINSFNSSTITKPFLIEWDGNTTDLVCFMNYMYKVSDYVPSIDALDGSVYTRSNSSLENGETSYYDCEWTHDDEYSQSLSGGMPDILVVHKKGVNSLNLEPGVYFAKYDNGMHIVCLKNPNATMEINYLSDMHISDRIARTSYVDSAIATIPAVTVDTDLSSTSTNPVQNNVVKAALDKKADATELENLVQSVNGQTGEVSLSYSDIEGTSINLTNARGTDSTSIEPARVSMSQGGAFESALTPGGLSVTGESGSMTIDVDGIEFPGSAKITGLAAPTADSDAANKAYVDSNKYTHPTYTARTGKPTADATPAFGGTFKVSQITSDTTGHVTGATDRTITIPSATATTSAAGLMSADDKTKLNGIATGANKYTHPSSHPASMITGLATVATSGSYNDLSDKPERFVVNLTFADDGSVTGDKTITEIYNAYASGNEVVACSDGNVYYSPVMITDVFASFATTINDVYGNTGWSTTYVQGDYNNNWTTTTVKEEDVDTSSFVSTTDLTEPSFEWSTSTLPTSAYWVSAAFGRGVFVTVARASNSAAYSTDCITWTSSTLPANAAWRYVTYGGGVFVAVASDTNVVACSTDGKTWSSSTLPASSGWYSVVYGNGVFVAPNSDSGIVAVSSDGINWSSHTFADTVDFDDLAYGNGMFVAPSAQNYCVYHSRDGVNWSAVDTPGNDTSWQSVVYGNGMFVAVANGSEYMIYSTDGLTWYESMLPYSTTLYSLTYCNGTFIAACNSDTTYFYSTNGMWWSEATLPVAAKWRLGACGNGMVVIPAQGTDAIAYAKTTEIFAAQPDKGVIYEVVSDVISKTDAMESIVVNIPRGRIKGDLDYDGEITSNDGVLMQNGPTSVDNVASYWNQNFSTVFPDGNIPEDFLAADIDGNGTVNITDYGKITNVTAQNRKYGFFGELLGNWTINPNWETEAYQFYCDVANNKFSSNKDCVLIVHDIFDDIQTKFEMSEGNLRIYVDRPPIVDSDVAVMINNGSGQVTLSKHSGIKPVDNGIVNVNSGLSKALTYWLRQYPYHAASFKVTYWLDDTYENDWTYNVSYFINENATTANHSGYGIVVENGDEYLIRLWKESGTYYLEDGGVVYEVDGSPTDIKILSWKDKDNNDTIIPLNTALRGFGPKGKVLGLVDDNLLGYMTLTAADVGALPADGPVTIADGLTLTDDSNADNTTTIEASLLRLNGVQTLYHSGSQIILASDSLPTKICGSAITSSKSITVSSDERLKENIAPVDTDACVEFIKNLNVKTFNYIDSEDPCIGVVAQDVNKLNPEIAKRIVGETPDGYYSVKISDLVFPLITMVQQLSEEVEMLKSELNNNN